MINIKHRRVELPPASTIDHCSPFTYIDNLYDSLYFSDLSPGGRLLDNCELSVLLYNPDSCEFCQLLNILPLLFCEMQAILTRKVNSPEECPLCSALL